jgi:hypothetical protein
MHSCRTSGSSTTTFTDASERSTTPNTPYADTSERCVPDRPISDGARTTEPAHSSPALYRTCRPHPMTTTPAKHSVSSCSPISASSGYAGTYDRPRTAVEGRPTKRPDPSERSSSEPRSADMPQGFTTCEDLQLMPLLAGSGGDRNRTADPCTPRPTYASSCGQSQAPRCRAGSGSPASRTSACQASPRTMYPTFAWLTPNTDAMERYVAP